MRAGATQCPGASVKGFEDSGSVEFAYHLWTPVLARRGPPVRSRTTALAGGLDSDMSGRSPGGDALAADGALTHRDGPGGVNERVLADTEGVGLAGLACLDVREPSSPVTVASATVLGSVAVVPNGPMAASPTR